jgi:hypothetical protein
MSSASLFSLTNFTSTYRNQRKARIPFLTIMIPFTYEIPTPNYFFYYEFEHKENLKSFTWDDMAPVDQVESK